jgi:hypothetical protein
MRTFRECRRAWDFGGRMRRDLVPVAPVAPFDFDQAVHAGLAAYYLPAMDDWNRSIVRPLAVEGFRRAMREARGAYEDVAALDAEAADAWGRHIRLGELVLHRYFAFAAAFDDFDSVLADEDLWVPVPDPNDPGRELGTPDGRPVRFLCRLDQLISDDDDEWWVVDHCVRRDGWADDATLLGDLDTVRTWWALEVAYPQVYVVGTVHNELLVTADDERAPAPIDAAGLDVPPDGAELDRRDMSAGARHANLRRAPQTPEERILWAAVDRPDEIVHREALGPVRRTWIRRGRGDVHDVGFDIAAEATAMLAEDVPVPPSPSEVCGRCPFLHPCLVIEGGGDPEPVLAASYRPRRADEFDEAGLRSAARRQARSGLGR